MKPVTIDVDSDTDSVMDSNEPGANSPALSAIEAAGDPEEGDEEMEGDDGDDTAPPQGDADIHADEDL